MRTVSTLLILLAAVVSAQEGPKLLGPKQSIITPGIASGSHAVPAQQPKTGAQLSAWVQINAPLCSVPLVRAEIKINDRNAIPVPDGQGRDGMPKVTLPAPPCDRAANAVVIRKMETRTEPASRDK